MSNNLDFTKIMYISPVNDNTDVDYNKFHQCQNCKLTFNYKDIDNFKIVKGTDDYVSLKLDDNKHSVSFKGGLPKTNDSVSFDLQEILITSPSIHTFNLQSFSQGEVIFIHYNKEKDMYLNIYVLLFQNSSIKNDPITTQMYNCLQQALINYNTPKKEKKISCDGYNPQDLLNYEAISKDYIYYLSNKDKTLNVVVSEPVYINEIFTSALQTANKNYKIRKNEKITKFDKSINFFYYTVPEEEQKKQICFGSGPKTEEEIKEYCQKHYSDNKSTLKSTKSDDDKKDKEKNDKVNVDDIEIPVKYHVIFIKYFILLINIITIFLWFIVLKNIFGKVSFKSIVTITMLITIVFIICSYVLWISSMIFKKWQLTLSSLIVTAFLFIIQVILYSINMHTIIPKREDWPN